MSAPPGYEAASPVVTAPAHSLRRRLLASVMVVILLAALFQAFSAYQGALKQADEMFDYHLQQMAYSLRGGPALAAPQSRGDVDEDANDYVIQIWGANGVQLFQSTRGAVPPRAVLGFSEATLEGSRYRIYSLQTPYQTIQIAQDMTGRATRARALAVRAMLPMALVAPLLMLILWWVIRRSLAPLERTRQQVAQRELDDLSPLPESGLPVEVQPLVKELNLLFGRLQKSADSQKAFVENAAHELRSPLTALKVQAQALARVSEGGPTNLVVTRLNQGIDRAIRMMNQLLVLARQESPDNAQSSWKPIELNALIDKAMADLAQTAKERAIAMGQRSEESAWVKGDEGALEILMRNLLDNAIKYTPVGGFVQVAVKVRGALVILSVDDSGPGISEPDRHRVVERFYRGADTAAASEGSGLGLAIAQTIAARHRATMKFEHSSALGGLRVELAFAEVKNTNVLAGGD